MVARAVLALLVILLPAGAAQAQGPAAPGAAIDGEVAPSRAELARLRADAVEQIRQGTCVEPAREVRDAITALRSGPRGVVRRALLAYLATQRERLVRCSIGGLPRDVVGGDPARPLDPAPIPDGEVLVTRDDVRAEAPDGRDPAPFFRFLRIHVAMVRYCYEREGLRHDPGLRGRADLRVVVGADGRIASIETIGTPGMPSAVVDCVRARLRSRVVSRHEGAEVSGTYAVRLRFQPE